MLANPKDGMIALTQGCHAMGGFGPVAPERVKLIKPMTDCHVPGYWVVRYENDGSQCGTHLENLHPADQSREEMEAEYVAYLEQEGLPAFEASELIGHDLKPAHYRWVGNFIARWAIMERAALAATA